MSAEGKKDSLPPGGAEFAETARSTERSGMGLSSRGIGDCWGETDGTRSDGLGVGWWRRRLTEETTEGSGERADETAAKGAATAVGFSSERGLTGGAGQERIAGHGLPAGGTRRSSRGDDCDGRISPSPATEMDGG